MIASHGIPPAPRVPADLAARAAASDRAGTELRRVLLRHLAFDVHPSRLARVVVTLCAAIEPLLVPPTVSVRAGMNLSDREVQVLVGMATGLSNAQIGRGLHLSEDTVKTYARRLYATLDVRDRAHAVARGFQLGILHADGAGDPGEFQDSRSLRQPSPVGGAAQSPVAALRPAPAGSDRGSS